MPTTLESFRSIAEARMTRPKSEEPQRIVGTRWGRFSVTHKTSSDSWLVTEDGAVRHWLIVKGLDGGLPCVRLYFADESGGIIGSKSQRIETTVEDMLTWLAALEVPAPTVVTERPVPKGPPEGWIEVSAGDWSWKGSDQQPRLWLPLRPDGDNTAEVFHPLRKKLTPDDLLAAGRALMDLGAYLARVEAKP